MTVQSLAAETYINDLNGGEDISITIINNPLPRTQNQLKTTNTISGFFGALIFSIAFGFKYSSIVSFIVRERVDKSKHQQIVSGMNIVSYWVGNFIYDYVLYLILAIFAVVISVALDI